MPGKLQAAQSDDGESRRSTVNVNVQLSRDARKKRSLTRETSLSANK